MRALTLLRHAKSSWEDRSIRDFDRPLNERGRRAAAVMGAFIRREGLAFDHVLASPAVRVRETIACVEATLGRSLEAQFDKGVYMASSVTLLEHLAAVPGNPARILLIGHNPGLEDLALQLVPEADPLRALILEKYPTAALAELELDVESWTAATDETARLTRFTCPRDLDPELGPEED